MNAIDRDPSQATDQSLTSGSAEASSADEGQEGSNADGHADTAIDGVATGINPEPAPPRKPPAPLNLMYIQGKNQLAIDPHVPPYKAELPKALLNSEVQYRTVARICVGTNGAVSSVSMAMSAGPAVDDAVQTAIRRWRYTPLTLNGVPAPFCYHQPYIVQSN